MSQRNRSVSRGRNRLPFHSKIPNRRPSADPPGTKGSGLRRSPQSRHTTKNPIRDSSILKGAEILRREISEAKKYSEQDPWRNPSHSRQERPHEEISELTVNADDAAYWAARPSLGHEIYEDVSGDYGRHGRDEDEEVEDYVRQVPRQPLQRTTCENKKTDDSNMGTSGSHNIASNNADEDSVSVLERAMAFLGTSSSKSADSVERKTTQQDLFQNHSPPSLVQRVSDMEDNKSFASMFANSYLPSQFFPGSFGKNSNNPQEDDEEEELETSTLDYIASMYPQKEDPKTAGTDRRSNTPVQILSSRPRSSTQETSRSDRLLQSPRITEAATPFERMIAPSSYFYDELMRDPAYQHAAEAGILWQSLCSQHVRFPALWYDSTEPASPPLGTAEKQSWRYLGRHRVKADRKLNSLIGNRGSSGRILLHLVVRDDVTCETIEDISCGVFHPNARGVRTSESYDPQVEDCRDVWIGHRRRFQGEALSLLEASLKRQNKNRVFASPLGGPKSSSTDIRNSNLKAVFGEKPPLFTVMVTESEIFELLRGEGKCGSPMSVILLRRYLRYRIG